MASAETETAVAAAAHNVPLHIQFSYLFSAVLLCLHTHLQSTCHMHKVIAQATAHPSIHRLVARKKYDLKMFICERFVSFISVYFFHNFYFVFRCKFRISNDTYWECEYSIASKHTHWSTAVVDGVVGFFITRVYGMAWHGWRYAKLTTSTFYELIFILSCLLDVIKISSHQFFNAN